MSRGLGLRDAIHWTPAQRCAGVWSFCARLSYRSLAMAPFLRSVLLLGALVPALSIGLSHAEDDPAPASEASPPSRPRPPAEGEVGLRNVLRSLQRTPRLYERLRPDYAACRGVVHEQADAIRLFHSIYRFYAGFVKSRVQLGASGGLLSEGLLQVQAVDGPTLEAERDSEATKGVAARLATGARLWRVWIGGPTGPAEGQPEVWFAPHAGTWRAYPHLPRVLEDKQLLDDPFSLFVLSINRGKWPTAHALLSSRIQEQLPAEQLRDWVHKWGWSPLKDFEWSQNGGARRYDSWFTWRRGEATFEDGRKAYLGFYGGREGNDIRIAYMTQHMSWGIAPPSTFAPPPEEARRIVKRVLGELVRAFEAKDYAAFHQGASEAFRDAVTVNQIEEGFKEQAAQADAYAIVREGRVAFSRPPGLMGDTSRGRDWFMDPHKSPASYPFHMEGHVHSADGSRSFSFLLDVVFEGDAWRAQLVQLGQPQTGAAK